MTGCAIIPSDSGYVSGILDYVDCQARTIGALGYFALTQPSSQAALLITVMLTILVALIGYRLLLGHVPSVRDAVLTMAKIGLVLALATSWSAYRTLAYDIALESPGEIAAEVGGSARLSGTAGYMNGHLDAVDQLFQSVAVAGVGGPIAYDIAKQVPPPLFTGYETFALGASRTAFLVGVIGAIGATRLMAGILLAVGPLFFGFLLFDATRGLFGAWLKGLVGAALGSLFVSITLGMEIGLFEPWLASLIQQRNAGNAILTAPSQLLAVSIVFSLFLLVSVIAGARLGGALNLAAAGQVIQSRVAGFSSRDQDIVSAGRAAAKTTPIADISRASALAETVTRTEQRHARAYAAAEGGGVAASSQQQGASNPGSAQGTRASPTRPRHLNRGSASAARRDRR